MSTRLDLPPSSLIICSRNRPQMLSETVASILGADDVPTELIIIDQSDHPNLYLKELGTDRPCKIQYIWTDIIGSSHARNRGVLAGSYDIVASIDDDMWVAPTWYGALVRTLVQGGPRCVVTGRVMPAPTKDKNSFVVAVHPWEEPKVYAGRIGRDILASGHMAMYRSAFQEIGGFDERLGPGTPFPGAEDNDYGFRLLEAGYRIIYQPDSVIYHRAWRSNRDYVPLFWKYGRGQGAFYAKHLTWRDRYMLRRMAGDFGRYLRLLPERIRKGLLTQLLGATAFVLGIISGAVQWRLTQRETRS
ncbi:MAG: glycosyltransferase family 2 protein [Acidobacteriota bacterium]